MKQLEVFFAGLLLFVGVLGSAEGWEKKENSGDLFANDPINFVCPGDFIGLIRHPYDCTLFYNCYLDKRPCLFECSDGLYFNPEPQWCDFPSNVPDCEGGSPPPPSTTPRLPAKDGRILNYRNANRQSFAKAKRSLEEMLESRNVIVRDPEACETIPSNMENVFI